MEKFFVTADGAETDLDFGNYERFIDKTLTSKTVYNRSSLSKCYQRKEVDI